MMSQESSNIQPSYTRISPLNFDKFVVAKRSHFPVLLAHSTELYGQLVNFDNSDLKRYQDLLVFAFIKDNIRPGARLLEVGGGDSRILRALAAHYECWNIDPCEGLGNGPKEVKNANYRLILDSMGNFNPQLPNNYFDFVFSISALEHVPEEAAIVDNILVDINRVLKKSGTSLHLLDTVFGAHTVIFMHLFIPRAFQTGRCIGELPEESYIAANPDTYFMSKVAYDYGWKSVTGKEFEQFGRPTSIQVLWQKE